jgi:hypothetical protein
MDNLAREHKAKEIKLNDIEGRRVEFINLSKERPGNWQYVDVDKLEARIRAEETAKWVEIRRRERAAKKLRKEAFWSTIMATLAIRILGLIVLVGGTSLALYFHVGEVVFAAWPIGTLFVLCPGHNSIDENIKKYIEHKHKEEKHYVRKD